MGENGVIGVWCYLSFCIIDFCDGEVLMFGLLRVLGIIEVDEGCVYEVFEGILVFVVNMF